jgi:pyridoxamine 5'-phosphate oxidase
MSANAMSDNDELQQIAHLRREYTKGGLRRQDLPAEPLCFLNAG